LTQTDHRQKNRVPPHRAWHPQGPVVLGGRKKIDRPEGSVAVTLQGLRAQPLSSACVQ
jgi:hypothetical protein